MSKPKAGQTVGQVDDLELMYERVGALDIGKREIVACVRLPAGGRGFASQVKTFSSMTDGLLGLADWLAESKVQVVSMEATGDYWKPVYYLLEGEGHQTWLINARQVKNVKGRKTDVNDAQWLARLTAFGLVGPSFVPPEPIRRLRDLTRQRANLVRDRARAINRLEKVLEDAGLKVSAVMSKTLNVSSRLMIGALIEGERDPQVLAEHAQKRARAKIPQLRRALVGRWNDHHSFLAAQALEAIDTIDAQIAAFTQRIGQELAPFEQARDLLVTIPGVAERTASIIIAEIGVDMSQFPTHQALTSWAGLAPGLNRSAGVNKSGATTNGDTWLKGALGDAAAAAARVKDSHLGVYYRRLAKRRGKKRALVAVMRKLLTAIWHMLTHNTTYQDLGADYYLNQPDQLERRKHRLINELAGLGVDVTALRAA